MEITLEFLAQFYQSREKAIDADAAKLFTESLKNSSKQDLLKYIKGIMSGEFCLPIYKNMDYDDVYKEILDMTQQFGICTIEKYEEYLGTDNDWTP